MNIEKAIRGECKKLIQRHQGIVVQNNAHRSRYERSTGFRGGPPNHIPPYWSVADHFNPYKVRRKADRAARSISLRLDADEYEPRPALIREIPKPDGGVRALSIFPVADAALGTACFRRIAARNQHRMSPFSYAFRSDIGVHEAIESLSRELEHRNRFWVVEFDFAKYFDTISHDYLKDVIHRYFKVTRREQQILLGTLGSLRAFDPDNYRQGNFHRLTRGVPQGNSLSLFFANVACHELDLALNRTSATFARYADDILLLCKTSAEADDVAELVLDHCERAGVAVNFDKSDGISRFGPEWASAKHAELSGSGKAAIDYLGYRFRFQSVNRSEDPAKRVVRRIAIRPKSLFKIRSRVSNIIYCHLLRYPERGLFTQARINLRAGVDWDLVTCINDLRNYMYGGLPEEELQRALRDRTTRLHLNRGVLSFYPLMNDVEQLKALDGWLASALASATKKRASLLANLNFQTLSFDREKLMRAAWYDDTQLPVANATNGATIQNDVRLPSFVRIWKYSRRCLNAFNLEDFPFVKVDS